MSSSLLLYSNQSGFCSAYEVLSDPKVHPTINCADVFLIRCLETQNI